MGVDYSGQEGVKRIKIDKEYFVNEFYKILKPYSLKIKKSDIENSIELVENDNPENEMQDFLIGCIKHSMFKLTEKDKIKVVFNWSDRLDDYINSILLRYDFWRESGIFDIKSLREFILTGKIEVYNGKA